MMTMSSVAIKVLSTVNAPYGTYLSPEQLASKISDFASVENFDASAFSFYSEVKAELQAGARYPPDPPQASYFALNLHA